MAIRAVTFDVGGTLIEPYPSVGAVYAAVAREHGHELCPDTLTRQFAEYWAGCTNFGYTRADWHEAVRHSFRGRMEVSQALFDRVYDRFAEAGAWRLYEDALPAIEALAGRGIRLAVISNWDERLEPLLIDLGLRGLFELVAVSGVIGAHKPDERIFQHALAGLKLQPGEVLHVGDSWREDVEGAQRAGLRAARIRRGGPERPGDIGALTALANLLEDVRECPSDKVVSFKKRI